MCLGGQVLELADGTDWEAMNAAVETAKATTDKPTMIKIRTIIGYGCPSKQGSHKVHGAPLGAAGLAEMKTNLGMDPEATFAVPADVAEHYAAVKAAGDVKAAEWAKALAAYTAAFPAEGAELARRIAGELPENWEASLKSYTAGVDPNLATRKWSEMSLNDLAPIVRAITVCQRPAWRWRGGGACTEAEMAIAGDRDDWRFR
jgi:transketolase|eukprot:COSAG01_NODE_4089_length_5361_cov_2.720258_8_plen_203_part_00